MNLENLTATVYECTLPVEAHMICDLLARAGISARVDGEFLAGAGGDLPLGSNVKVRVDPTRVTEARAVIDEWERTQPPAEPMPPPRQIWRSPLWFLAGSAAGAAVMMFALHAPQSSAGRGLPTRVTLDADADGKPEQVRHFTDGVLQSIDVYDARGERVLIREHYDNARMTAKEYDQDGDGVFERRVDYDRFGEPIPR